MSETRRRYFIRLYCRILIFIIGIVMCFKPNFYDILNGMNFFKKFHILHLLWFIWVIDIILQIIPIKNKIALGSQKLFKNRYRPNNKLISLQKVKDYIVKTTKSAYKVFIIWTILILVIGLLYYVGIINKKVIFMLSIFFYVCDLICVLIWCPFRLIMKNKCCTTCRIFNWDHLMMFSPLIFIGGFYSLSLVVLSILAWLVWEICVMLYPERFWEITNDALKCTSCTDKLCTQYCQKLKQSIKK